MQCDQQTRWEMHVYAPCCLHSCTNMLGRGCVRLHRFAPTTHTMPCAAPHPRRAGVLPRVCRSLHALLSGPNACLWRDICWETDLCQPGQAERAAAFLSWWVGWPQGQEGWAAASGVLQPLLLHVVAIWGCSALHRTLTSAGWQAGEAARARCSSTCGAAGPCRCRCRPAWRLRHSWRARWGVRQGLRLDLRLRSSGSRRARPAGGRCSAALLFPVGLQFTIACLLSQTCSNHPPCALLKPSLSSPQPASPVASSSACAGPGRWGAGGATGGPRGNNPRRWPAGRLVRSRPGLPDHTLYAWLRGWGNRQRSGLPFETGPALCGQHAPPPPPPPCRSSWLVIGWQGRKPSRAWHSGAAGRPAGRQGLRCCGGQVAGRLHGECRCVHL